MQAFGGYKGLKSFVDRANSLGIGVMLDIVSHNHCTKHAGNSLGTLA